MINYRASLCQQYFLIETFKNEQIFFIIDSCVYDPRNKKVYPFLFIE